MGGLANFVFFCWVLFVGVLGVLFCSCLMVFLVAFIVSPEGSTAGGRQPFAEDLQRQDGPGAGEEDQRPAEGEAVGLEEIVWFLVSMTRGTTKQVRSRRPW